MNSFWIAVILSIITSAVYIWFSVSQQEREPVKNEIKKDSKFKLIIPLLCFLMIPVGYSYLGSSESQKNWLRVNQVFSEIQQGEVNLSKNSDVRELLLGLRSSIQQEPNNGQLWFMLAESYFQLRMVDLADASITKALEIEPRPDWFVANAQILSMRSNESDISKSIYLLQRALSIQSNHQSALLTLGFVHLRLNEFQKSIDYWELLVVQLKQSGNDSQMIDRQIQFAKEQLSKPLNN